MDFGYRLMRGRQGVSGHARGIGERILLSARGLPPGTACALYGLRDQGCALLDTGHADRDGHAQFAADAAERLLLAADGRVVLWEDGPDAEEQYLRASAWLRKERERQTAPDENAAEAAPREAVTEPEPGGGEDEATKEAASALTANTAAPVPGEERQPKRYVHRPAGPGEPVDALPPLRWPAGTEDLRLNCTLRPPFAPFSAPGWRFVQVPSPLPQAPFCAVGYRAQDALVTEIAYAIPGSPRQIPVSLPGYRYHAGRHGQGYWVMTKHT